MKERRDEEIAKYEERRQERLKQVKIQKYSIK